MISYDLRSITHNQKPGQATINVICVGDIYDAVSLRNNCVRFFYYGQFKEHEIEFKISLREKVLPISPPNAF